MPRFIRQPRPKNDIKELIKPLGEKTWRGNIWQPIVMNVPKDGETPTPPVSPTPTPSNTPFPTPTPTPTPIPFDSDAAAYLSELETQGYTATTSERTYVDTFYKGLKSNNLYDRLISMYLHIGGSAATHAVDGITPGGSLDITFGGGVTYSLSGTTFDGINGYGDTNYTQTSLTDDNLSIGAFLSVATTSDSGAVMGARNNTVPTSATQIIPYQTFVGTTDDGFYQAQNSGPNYVLVDRTADAEGTQLGFHQVSKTGTTQYASLRQITGTSSVSLTNIINNANIWIGGRDNSSGADSYTDSQQQFNYIGESFNIDEMMAFETLVYNLQDSLGRAPY